jgi:Protein of unknown function (DUF2785)
MTTPDWNALREAEFALPDDADLEGYVDAGFRLLDSADPVERDDLAYPALATWLETGKLDENLFQIGDRAALLLTAPESYTRSFAALVLAEVVLRDASVQLLPLIHLHAWQSAWAGWYLDEQDLRGWIEGTGWIHALAHGADVAAVLAQHPALSHAQLSKLLQVLNARIQTVQELPHQSEDDRIALAAFLVLSRPEIMSEDIRQWLASVQAIWQPEYARPRSVSAAFAAQVARSLLMFAHLGALLPGGAVFPAPEPARLKIPLLAALKTAFPAYPD